MIGAKLLRVRFDKVGGFIRVYNRTSYLVLFGTRKYDVILNLRVRSGIAYVISHNFAKIKVVYTIPCL